MVYTSYQGFYLGERGWFDKRFIYDESFKTPLLIRWPYKITAGTTNDEMVQNLDFAQTFLDAANIGAPIDMLGESLISLLIGKDEDWGREAVYIISFMNILLYNLKEVVMIPNNSKTC